MTAPVLVVDDDPDMRFLVGSRLTVAGFSVAEAEDGSTALAYLDDNTVEAVVLDQRMPGLPGIEVARALRDRGFRRPIVLFSAYLDPELHEEAQELDIATLGKADVMRIVDLLTSEGAVPNG